MQLVYTRAARVIWVVLAVAMGDVIGNVVGVLIAPPPPPIYAESIGIVSDVWRDDGGRHVQLYGDTRTYDLDGRHSYDDAFGSHYPDVTDGQRVDIEYVQGIGSLGGITDSVVSIGLAPCASEPNVVVCQPGEQEQCVCQN